MATQKPVEWVVQLITRFEDQLPCRTGPQTHHSRINVQQNKECLIQISKFKFSLVISGLTKILQRINELRPTHTEFERDYNESLLIVLDTLEKCLSSQAQQVKYDEAMNVKLLLREICQFLDTGRDTSSYTDTSRDQLKNLSSKVKGFLGKKKLKDSKQRWPPLLDRDVSSDTEPDADIIPR